MLDQLFPALQEVKRQNFYRLSEVHKIPDVPGIYGWYLFATEGSGEDYYKIFKKKKLSVQIKGPLQEKYQGEARCEFDEKDFRTTESNTELFAISSFAFSPPVYIGISKNLKRRIGEHWRKLNKIFLAGGISEPQDSEALGIFDLDTIVESEHFAQRFGYSLKGCRTINLNSIFIKTIEMRDGYPWGKLQKVEKYLNRTYLPIYGRK